MIVHIHQMVELVPWSSCRILESSPTITKRQGGQRLGVIVKVLVPYRLLAKLNTKMIQLIEINTIYSPKEVSQMILDGSAIDPCPAIVKSGMALGQTLLRRSYR